MRPLRGAEIWRLQGVAIAEWEMVEREQHMIQHMQKVSASLQAQLHERTEEVKYWHRMCEDLAQDAEHALADSSQKHET